MGAGGAVRTAPGEACRYGEREMTTKSKAVRWGLRLVGIGMILTALALAAWSFGLLDLALTESK